MKFSWMRMKLETITFDENFQRRKWNILIQLEDEKRKRDPSFPRFFAEEPNILKMIDLYIDNFKKLYGKLVGGDISLKKAKFLVKKPKGVVIFDAPSVVFIQESSLIPPPSKIQRRYDPISLVPYDDTEEVGYTDKDVSDLRALKDDEGFDQP